MRKPTIAMRKEAETEFVNARTYWSLSLAGDWACGQATYELRVKHQEVDRFTFLRWTDGDCAELLGLEALADRVETLAMNEPTDCARHKAMGPAESAREWEESGSLDAEGWYCDACHEASLANADASLAALETPPVLMNVEEETVREDLVRAWEAFRQVCEPEVNVF